MTPTPNSDEVEMKLRAVRIATAIAESDASPQELIEIADEILTFIKTENK